MEIAKFKAKLAFAQLYNPGSGPEGRTETYSVACIFDPEDEAALPSWIEIKDGLWRNASIGVRHITATSVFKPPIYGLSEGWHAQVIRHNLSPDRLLVGARAEVGISRTVKTDRNTGNERNYMNLIAVRVLVEPSIPDFDEVLEAERRR